MTSALSLDAVDLRDVLERSSETEREALPFGVIHLDAAGQVTWFSATEARQSGFEAARALGRSFFTEVAPCMGTPAFRERLARARAAGAVDISFEQIGDFRDAQRELRVRVLSAAGGGVWVCLARD